MEIKDYVTVLPVENEKIEKYESKLPLELINIWKEKGFGTFLNGYLKVIDPDYYMGVFKDSYFDSSKSIPIMITAFGDIITYQEGDYIGIVMYRIGDFDIVCKTFDSFMELMGDIDFLKEDMDDDFPLDLYDEAVEKYGQLKYDECFGFVPLLALGGKEDVDHIKPVKAREHIAVICSMLGPV